MREKFMKTLSDAIAFLNESVSPKIITDIRPQGVLKGESYMRREVEEILFDSRDNAEYVLDRLKEQVGKNGHVAVFDLYRYIGSINSPLNNKYGWTNLNSARVQETSKALWRVGIDKGYRLILPEIIDLSTPKVMTDVPSSTPDAAKRFLDQFNETQAILKLLGTEYMMELSYDTPVLGFVLSIRDSQDRISSKAFSELEVAMGNHNVLLRCIEECITSLKEMG